jgi:hypothetical protein
MRIHAIANGWRFALTVLAVAVALLVFGNTLARIIGVALLVAFIALVRGLDGRGRAQP